MRTAALLGVVVALLAMVAGAAAASGPVSIDAVDTTAHPRTALTVTVGPELRDEALPPEAFTVEEDGETRSPIVEPAAPEDLEIVLVVETADSTDATRRAAVAGAVQFVLRLPPEARTGLIHNAAPATPSTEDSGEVVAALSTLDANGQGALVDDVEAALDHLSPSGATRRVLVVAAGGQDSAPKAAEVGARVAAQGIAFYGIDLSTREPSAGALGQMADAARGRVVAADADTVGEAYRTFATDLDHQYVLTFEAPGQDSTLATVTVEWDGVTAEMSRTVVRPTAQEPSNAQTAPGAPAEAPAEATPAGTPWPVAGRLAVAALGLALLATAVVLVRRRAEAAQPGPAGADGPCAAALDPGGPPATAGGSAVTTRSAPVGARDAAPTGGHTREPSPPGPPAMPPLTTDLRRPLPTHLAPWYGEWHLPAAEEPPDDEPEPPPAPEPPPPPVPEPATSAPSPRQPPSRRMAPQDSDAAPPPPEPRHDPPAGPTPPSADDAVGDRPGRLGRSPDPTTASGSAT